MIELYVDGSAFDLDSDKHTVAEVFELMDKHAGSQTWFFLANGSTVHLRLPEHPTYAVVTDTASK